MTDRPFELSYRGFWELGSTFYILIEDSIPNCSGIYSVYACKRERANVIRSSLRLIYIGEADHVRDRIQNHDKRTKWEECLESGEGLCIAVADFPWVEDNRKSVEAALIYKHPELPLINEKHRESYDGPDISVETEGMNDGLKNSFAAP